MRSRKLYVKVISMCSECPNSNWYQDGGAEQPLECTLLYEDEQGHTYRNRMVEVSSFPKDCPLKDINDYMVKSLIE